MLQPSPGFPQPLLRVEKLAKTFDLGPRAFSGLRRRSRPLLRAVQDVTFAVNRGETLSLVGESGCGKSTVAKLVTGLYRADSGKVFVDGEDVTALAGRRARRPFARRLQMIFQDPFASLNPRWTVAAIVAEPIRAFGLARGADEIGRRVAAVLDQVGLAAADAAKYPHEFSGGQRQRISIARALASEPEFLVCDEPTSALDVSVQAQILNLLQELQRRLHLGVLFISHNLAVVSHVSHVVGVMYLGRLVEIGPAEALFRHPRHPYTRLLIDTIPDIEMSGTARAPISGEVPNPIQPPAGCAFHPRCPLVGPRCRSETPAPRLVGEALVACHAIEPSTAEAQGMPAAAHVVNE